MKMFLKLFLTALVGSLLLIDCTTVVKPDTPSPPQEGGSLPKGHAVTVTVTLENSPDGYQDDGVICTVKTFEHPDIGKLRFHVTELNGKTLKGKVKFGCGDGPLGAEQEITAGAGAIDTGCKHN